jgi:hypothetical protein
MKYLFIHLEVQDGERRHDHRILHATKANDIVFAAQRYASTYWGTSSLNKETGWWEYNACEFAIRVKNVIEISEYEHRLMSEIFAGRLVDRNYFKLQNTGWSQASEREEVEINAGENGKIMIYQDVDKLGFIVDVYGQNDHIDSLTIWEDDLNPKEE